MADKQQQEKKQFSVPGRDELIQQIKQLDQDLQHVTLNLIKCDFNATQKDVEKTFSDITFVKVKNYNPGSFQVVFQMKIDAINFIRNHYDKKILNRRFFIKMGRQQKELVEEWTGVGYVPKTFKGPYKPHNQNKQPYNKNRKVQGQQTQEKTQTNAQGTVNSQSNDKKQQVKQAKTQEQKKQEEKYIPQQKKQGKHIPKTEYQKKPYNPNYKKPYNKTENQGQKTEGNNNTTTEYKKQSRTIESKKQETQGTKYNKQDKKDKKEQKKVQPVKQPETKEQDDGWIVVSKKTTNKKR